MSDGVKSVGSRVGRGVRCRPWHDEPVTERYSCADDEERERGIEAAVQAVRDGGIVVFPTDTVYGVGGDAFDPSAVRKLLRAKGRGRDMPPPVLVSAPETLEALADQVPPQTRALIDAFWPGPLTVVCKQQSSLNWDLGDNRGTVAIRMPDDEVALALLSRTGPLAVSSANMTGRPAASTAGEAEEMLGSRSPSTSTAATSAVVWPPRSSTARPAFRRSCGSERSPSNGCVRSFQTSKTSTEAAGHRR